MEYNQNILLSYPRSGNHLCRFFIELLTGIPTYGCIENSRDIEIYKNIFDKPIPFNIQQNFDKNKCYFKYHTVPPKNIKPKSLILLIRNPKEVLLRHCGDKLNINNDWCSYENYFKIIDFYNKYMGKKIIFYYEDIITNKKEFINKLSNFLDINDLEKKNYILSNIDELFKLSSNGKNRAWGGVNSNFEVDYYYKKISISIKKDFDNYLNEKIKKYDFLKKKYFI
jgi:hypothetical protein